jgi:hypothetical protein
MAPAITIDGAWRYEANGGKSRGQLHLAQQGARFQGTLKDEVSGEVGIIDGSIEGQTVRFTRTWPGKTGAQHFEMTVSGDGTQIVGVGTHWDNYRFDIHMTR